MPRYNNTAIYQKWWVAGADLGEGGGVQGVRTPPPPLSYMKNDVMRTVISAAFCISSLDLQDCTSRSSRAGYIDLIKSSYMCINEIFNRAIDRMVHVSRN